jgi:hypothetical protein
MIFFREINPLSYRLLERIYRQSRHHQASATKSPVSNINCTRGKNQRVDENL